MSHERADRKSPCDRANPDKPPTLGAGLRIGNGSGAPPIPLSGPARGAGEPEGQPCRKKGIEKEGSRAHLIFLYGGPTAIGARTFLSIFLSGSPIRPTLPRAKGTQCLSRRDLRQ